MDPRVIFNKLASNFRVLLIVLSRTFLKITVKKQKNQTMTIRGSEKNNKI